MFTRGYDLLTWQVSYIPLGVDTNEFRIAALDTGTVRHGLEKTTYAVRVQDGFRGNTKPPIRGWVLILYMVILGMVYDGLWRFMALGVQDFYYDPCRTWWVQVIPQPGVQGVLGLAAEEWLQDPKPRRRQRSQDLWASDLRGVIGTARVGNVKKVGMHQWICGNNPPVWTKSQTGDVPAYWFNLHFYRVIVYLMIKTTAFWTISLKSAHSKVQCSTCSSASNSHTLILSRFSMIFFDCLMLMSAEDEIIAKYGKSHPNLCERLEYLFFAQERFEAMVKAWREGNIAEAGDIATCGGSKKLKDLQRGKNHDWV